MNPLVVYYSNSGNNRFLAEKIAQALSCDIEQIRPRIGGFPVLALFSVLKTSPGIKPIDHRVSDHDPIIVCGPIWMGQIIAPLRGFIKKYLQEMKHLYFVTCCGSDDAKKDDKFGYGGVFAKVKALAGDNCIGCEAFPIGWSLPEEKRSDDEAMMKARLSEDNFSGELQVRLDAFVEKVRSQGS